jgi:hypothetical protein
LSNKALNIQFGQFNQFARKSLPTMPKWWVALGPGIVWMALAQGSGELIWWPYLIAKYGLTFLALLIPACLLQYPITREIGRYTLLTGESIFQGFFRLNKNFGIFLWILMTLSFLWFGAFASAGGTALAELTHFPSGWSSKQQTLFWGYATILLFAVSVFLSRHIYKFIENFMKIVALITVFGLLWACSESQVIQALPSFVAGLSIVPTALPSNWQSDDATKLLTAITFAGLGGFWILFYSYWLRDKGSGMATNMPRITGVVKTEVETTQGFMLLDNSENKALWASWRRFLTLDISIGILGNLLTTLMMCLLAWALLYPKGLIPQEYEIAVVQAQFFEVSWGVFGKALFLVIAAAFLADTWLATADAVSRTQADIIYTLFPKARKYAMRQWYLAVFALLTVITGFTMSLDTPGSLILLSALIGFAGTVMFPVALYLLNHRLLAPALPSWARPSKWSAIFLWMSFLVYLSLASMFIYLKFFHG